MEIKKVTLVGGGVLGSQIAYQTAYCGYDVSIYLRTEASVARCRAKIARWHQIYISELEDAKKAAGTDARVSQGLIPDIKHTTVEEIDVLIAHAEKAYENMKFDINLASALKGADLVIEAVVEDPQQKIDVYKRMAPFVEKNAVILTNSSALLPSQFAAYTGRPGKFLAMHFENLIWKINMVEIMGHSQTDPDAFDSAVAFAKSINMMPMCLKKEYPGYILNAMIMPLMQGARELWGDDVADIETIDETFKKSSGLPYGPFRLMDSIGIPTIYAIGLRRTGAEDPNHVQYKINRRLKAMIDRGELGAIAGKGFYKDYSA
jgi:3-hydroxyacyl-CoA dehydrogenase